MQEQKLSLASVMPGLFPIYFYLHCPFDDVVFATKKALICVCLAFGFCHPLLLLAVHDPFEDVDDRTVPSDYMPNAIYNEIVSSVKVRSIDGRGSQ